MDITAIRHLTTNDTQLYVPPLADYKDASVGWKEAEYRHFEAPSPRVVVGFWTGAPGEVTLEPWPYTEVCSILSGRVAIADQSGNRLEFEAGMAFIVPKGFAGRWITVEPASKIFVAIS